MVSTPQFQSETTRYGEGRDEHHFIRDLLWQAFNINALTDHKICLHMENGATLLIDPYLPEPDCHSHENWAITTPDVWLPGMGFGHGIYIDGFVHMESVTAGHGVKRVMHQDNAVNSWYNRARETHSRIDSQIILAAMKTRSSHFHSRQYALAGQIMEDIMKARFERFKILLPTGYGGR